MIHQHIKFFMVLLTVLSATRTSTNANDPASPSPSPAIKTIDVYPHSLSLYSRRQPVRLIVTASDESGTEFDVTDQASFASTAATLVNIEANRVYPLANGQCEVIVSVGDQSVKVPLTIALAEADSVSLRNEVLAVLSKQGCSSGACHGSPRGKGGFRLSLRAFDPSVDESTLRNEFFSRRTNSLDPDTSLLLKKPLMEVPHAGGRRLTTGSTSHQLLRQWIAEGTRLDIEDTAHCLSIQLFPPSGRELTVGHPAQRHAVYATFSDQTVKDVTDLAVFSSSDTAVAEVDESGLVTRAEGARGQTAITVRYLEHMATSYLVSVAEVEGFRWPAPTEANFIDELVHQRLKQLRYTPSDRCSDSEFIRRVSLDVTGLLPTVEATQVFLADSSTGKRSVVIDELLSTSEHAKFMALKWGDLLRIKASSVKTAGVFKYHRWLVRTFEQNLPYDEFAEQLLTSSGSTFESPPANYFRTATDTNDCTESTAQIFLGARLECAKCHNHPHERWTQDNYYGLGAFFNRIQREPTERTDELFVSVAAQGEVTQPRTGQTMKPWLPQAGTIETDAPDRRGILVDWLTESSNPFFARVEVNRLWSQMMGKGIVEPIDDFRDSNPPSNSDLLDRLAKEFVDSGFDRRHILRLILNSETYQRSSASTPANEEDGLYFSHYLRRLLSAEQLLDAICDVSGVPETFGNLPAGTRATQLPSPDFGKSFLKVFGQPERKSVCRCERSEDLNLSQALQVANGSFVHGKLVHGNNRFRQLLKANRARPDIIKACYIAAYSRMPTESEIATFAQFVAKRKDRPSEQAYEDLLWSLINSNEFLFQH